MGDQHATQIQCKTILKLSSDKELMVLGGQHKNMLKSFANKHFKCFGPLAIGGVCWTEAQLLYALKQGQLFGVASRVSPNLQAVISFIEDKFHFHILYLATSPDFLRQRIMFSIISGLVDKSKLLVKPIWLEVSVKNRIAQKLYAQLGFEVVGERLNYYKNGDNALLYSFTP